MSIHYVHKLLAGQITFDDFVWGHIQDLEYPYNIARDPDSDCLSTYRRACERVADLEKERQAYQSWTDADWQACYQDEVDAANDLEDKKARILIRRAEVAAWHLPTPEHDIVKAAMLYSLDMVLIDIPSDWLVSSWTTHKSIKIDVLDRMIDRCRESCQALLAEGLKTRAWFEALRAQHPINHGSVIDHRVETNNS